MTAAVTRLTTDTPLTVQFARERAEFEAGYIAGYHVGHELGVQHGEATADRIWSEAIAGMQQTAGLVPYADLAERRAEDPTTPCQRKCRRCSRCIRSWSYWSRGGRDYAGRERNNAQIRAALAASAQRARTEQVTAR